MRRYGGTADGCGRSHPHRRKGLRQLDAQDEAQVLAQPSPVPQASTIGVGVRVTVVSSSHSSTGTGTGTSSATVAVCSGGW